MHKGEGSLGCLNGAERRVMYHACSRTMNGNLPFVGGEELFPFSSLDLLFGRPTTDPLLSYRVRKHSLSFLKFTNSRDDGD
ncbi:hypothetical protein GOP47_0008414 [Adiantum capillus-veneris]|uniref:Uncharacterized protein n=1 Tax=Adiantum capillus-veneris TaxID=13818 RepID=A0A9D4UYN3_ADICA|nr:hypothetical protein GOP47_0008414 [Adiantum capillus-veneris]